MAAITRVWAKEILDSRGNPTVETYVFLDNGVYGRCAVPSGASAGLHEALEMRDGDARRFGGLGVLKAVSNVNDIIGPALAGMDCQQQGNIDSTLITLDGTPNKSNLGSNAVLSVSLAACQAASIVNRVPLYRYMRSLLDPNNTTYKIPSPMFNILNGGKHGVGNLEFQEYMITLNKYQPYNQALQIGCDLYRALKDVLIFHNVVNGVGDEGGFAPNLFTNQDALELMMEAIRATPYRFGSDIFLSLDVAASYFYKDGRYKLKDRSAALNREQMIDFLKDLNNQYHLLSLEDPLTEDDWDGWIEIMQAVGSNTLIIGDDLIATNPERLKKAISIAACNAIIVKPNQIGTLTETLQVIQMAKSSNMTIVVSHRSGETNDTYIADLGVAASADYVKFGAPARGERVAKYNRLLEIELELSAIARTQS